MKCLLINIFFRHDANKSFKVDSFCLVLHRNESNSEAPTFAAEVKIRHIIKWLILIEFKSGNKQSLGGKLDNVMTFSE